MRSSDLQGEYEMNRQSAEAAARPVSSRRWVVPSVCIVDAKQHIRAFLGTALALQL
jgi:hypothetical protein